MREKRLQKYQEMIQKCLDMALQELTEVIDQEIEERPDYYFGVGIYEDD